MKKYYLLLTVILLSYTLISQVPHGFSYQILVRDAEGTISSNLPVNFKMSIVNNSPEGELIYAPPPPFFSTNNFGLATPEIGSGNPIFSNFQGINWGEGNYFLIIKISTGLLKEYELLGISLLLSVPYAFYAEQSGLRNLPVYSQSQIDTLNAIASTTILNSTTYCINYFTGISWMEICGDCSPQPSPSNAGPDQIIIGTETILQGNFPEIGSGIWEIISGSGGEFGEPAHPENSFSQIQESSYQLSWIISHDCGSEFDNVMISFMSEPPPSPLPVDGMIFAPYAEYLLWPNFDISDYDSPGICLYSLAFNVNNENETGANPYWGGLSTLVMDYYQDKVTALRDQGKDIIMSFGGANGIELSYAAADKFEARNAYKTVIDAYDLTSIYFDIEGFMVFEPVSRERRSKVMKLLQTESPSLLISLTHPVITTGPTNDGLNTIQSAIDNDVSLHCENIRAMDYGRAGIDMGDAAISAGNTLFGQLKTLYQIAGYSLPDSVI